MWERISDKQELEVVINTTTGEYVEIRLPELGINLISPYIYDWRNTMDAVDIILGNRLYEEMTEETPGWYTVYRVRLTKDSTIMLLEAMDLDDQILEEGIIPIRLPIPIPAF